MIVGIPKEVKEHEYRVAMTPEGVMELKKDNHRIIVERSAGEGSGFYDEEYQQAGAELSDKKSLFKESELIIKVKEPLPSEYSLFQHGQALFTYLHLAANPELADFMLEKRIAGFAYETLEQNGVLPLLVPMSEVAGRMAPLMAAYYLQRVYGGQGILMPGTDSIEPARVVVLGAGVVGMNAVQVAFGMGARVAVINRGQEKLKHIERVFNGKVETFPATPENIEANVLKADALIGAVLIPGAKAPKLVSKELVSKMKKGAVIVDVSVDQGGCVETTRPTSHTDPVYTVDGVIHYSVANMPGAYPRTSTFALSKRTLPYIKSIAENGIKWAAKEDKQLRSALNTYNGEITHSALAESLSGSD